mmetsp:Transcript_39595/g.104687  ORF Transcript_39595/g.104687 Transcript_39595/m.104687 type:complete len:243 (+) Transcript_39595:239-967(+)
MPLDRQEHPQGPGRQALRDEAEWLRRQTKPVFHNKAKTIKTIRADVRVHQVQCQARDADQALEALRAGHGVQEGRQVSLGLSDCGCCLMPKSFLSLFFYTTSHDAQRKAYSSCLNFPTLCLLINGALRALMAPAWRSLRGLLFKSNESPFRASCYSTLCVFSSDFTIQRQSELLISLSHHINYRLSLIGVIGWTLLRAFLQWLSSNAEIIPESVFLSWWDLPMNKVLWKSFTDEYLLEFPTF